MGKKREIMPVKTVTSPCSAPQGTFRQATRIFGDPGADKGCEGKSKPAENIYMERR